MSRSAPAARRVLGAKVPPTPRQSCRNGAVLELSRKRSATQGGSDDDGIRNGGIQGRRRRRGPRGSAVAGRPPPDPHVRVIEVDVSPAAYRDGHIDGAVLWNIYSDLKDASYRLMDAAALERVMARSGIGPDSTVVFYGYAPALGLWLMKLYGHPDVRILDCSRDTWRAAGRRWSAGAAQPAPGGVRLGDEDPQIRAGHAAVLDAIAGRARSCWTCAPRPSTRVSASGLRAAWNRWPGRPRSLGRPPDYRGPLPRRRVVPLRRRAAPRLFRGRPRRRRGAHRLLHHRRARRHRLVRPHPAARPRARPDLRRLMGRMGAPARRTHRRPVTGGAG